jgi:hypothetical protein
MLGPPEWCSFAFALEWLLWLLTGPYGRDKEVRLGKIVATFKMSLYDGRGLQHSQVITVVSNLKKKEE